MTEGRSITREFRVSRVGKIYSCYFSQRTLIMTSIHMPNFEVLASRLWWSSKNILKSQQSHKPEATLLLSVKLRPEAITLVHIFQQHSVSDSYGVLKSSTTSNLRKTWPIWKKNYKELCKCTQSNKKRLSFTTADVSLEDTKNMLNTSLIWAMTHEVTAVRLPCRLFIVSLSVYIF